MKNFWNWARDETAPDARVLRLEGTIAEESWFDDDVTPALFKDELFSTTGPVTVWINSPAATAWLRHRSTTCSWTTPATLL